MSFREWITVGWLSVALMVFPSVQHACGASDSGVKLVGRSDKDIPPQSWSLVNTQDNNIVAKIERKWGFAAAPPGRYVVRVLPQGSKALEIPWGEVAVEDGQTVTVKLESGVELLGRTADEVRLEHWDVVDKKTNKPISHTYRRWGFTPLPPGEYAISILPNGHEAVEIKWGDIIVEEGETESIKLATGVDVTGRSTDDAKLKHWKVIDKATNKPIANTSRRWGFTAVPSGNYSIRILPNEHDAEEVAWGDVTIQEGQIATVKVSSGIELAPQSDDEKPPKYWTVVDRETNTPFANVSKRWGFTPLPPGEYEIFKPPTRWGVKVIDGEVAKTSEPALEVRLARVTGVGQKTEKERDPEGFKKLEEEIEVAIRRGAEWLKRQSELGSIGKSLDLQNTRPTIGILALVHAGEFERDPTLANRCIDYLLRRSVNASRGTYANSITAMSLRDIAPQRYRSRMFECAQWLVENQGSDDTRKVWGYGDRIPGLAEPKPLEKQPTGARSSVPNRRRKQPTSLEVVRRGLISKPKGYWDNSCTQFAVLGLHAAVTTQIQVPQEVWERVEQHFHDDQNDDGGWGYNGSGTYGSMTCAGIASLVVARHHLAKDKPTLDPSVVKGLEWLASNFTVKENPKRNSHHYYYLYGLERVGVLAGTEFLGENEWYSVGARYLLQEQQADGSWRSREAPSAEDYLDTCYAILFLRRATLPLRPDEPAYVSVESEKGTVPLALLPAVELILDSSGSMAEQVEGRVKIDVARDVTNQLIKELPDEMPVGLRLYGHWGEWVARRTDPQAGKIPVSDPRLDTDSELVAKIRPLTKEHRKKIGEWLDFAQPRGKTPMIYSLLQAKHDFTSDLPGAKTVVLISDGVDTCGGKLEDVAAAYRGSDVAVVVHVVGFDIKDTDAEKQLGEIARLGGGIYYKASDARHLTAALQSALELRFEIWDEANQLVVAHGTVGGDPTPVKSGKYQLRVQHEHVKPITVELSSGDYVDVVLNETGQLAQP